ncbi:hypothetical protein MGWOODY_XGa458 [hydrothermal vent metagenome]|uniref:Uncharacterized protein n=1 Tax=hydrothermal vent metagenome TaxID=652676 RepID=A0A160TZ90_9ZZZZ
MIEWGPIFQNIFCDDVTVVAQPGVRIMSLSPRDDVRQHTDTDDPDVVVVK